jgi:hypothetical protein
MMTWKKREPLTKIWPIGSMVEGLSPIGLKTKGSCSGNGHDPDLHGVPVTHLYYCAVDRRTREIVGIGSTEERALEDSRRETAEGLKFELVTVAELKRIANGETQWPLAIQCNCIDCSIAGEPAH